jgi:TolA-binding protein
MGLSYAQKAADAQYVPALEWLVEHYKATDPQKADQYAQIIERTKEKQRRADEARRKAEEQARQRERARQQELARQQAAQRRKEARKQTLKKLSVFLLLLAVAAGLVYGVCALLSGLSPETKYADAMSCVENGDYFEAYQSLRDLGDYKDAASVAASIRYKALYPQMADAAVGETFLWGSYDQNGDPSDGAEDVEWVVIKEEGGKKLVLAKNILGTVPFHSKDTAIWSQSLLRMWMNNDFYNNAFTKEERAYIHLATIPNSLGGDTQDRIFALSEEEVSLVPSKFLEAKAKSGDSRWWLRTNRSYWGDYSDAFALTYYKGKIRGGDTMPSTPHGARPAMWVDLRSEEEKEAAYQNALAKYNAQQYEEALPLFQSIATYKDSTMYINKLPELIQLAPYLRAEVGQVIDYGKYSWRILAKEDGRMLLISNKVLSYQDFHNVQPAEPGWEGSSLRQWLNGKFLSSTFSDKEASRILLTTVENAVNPEFGTAVGGNTQDRVFLLSYEELMRYMPKNTDRIASRDDSVKPVIWWLRNPGKTGSYAMTVETDGSISYEGHKVYAYASGQGVRPAIWLDISVD